MDEYYNVEQNSNRGRKTRNTISNIFAIVIIIIAIVIYRKYDFNFYTKGIQERDKTTFSRDADIKYGKDRSYKIENRESNDAMFYKSISVTPNTPYRVTCMIKTQNVTNKDNNIMAGAQICLVGTEEHSDVLTGNNDWTKVEFLFDSKNNENVEIGFRLGGNLLNASGDAWFSNLTIEKGSTGNQNEWKFGCFILNNTDVTLNDGRNIKQTMTNQSKSYVYQDMPKFQNTIKEMSQNKININYDIIEIEQPLTTLTYEDDNGYYISEKDVYKLINDYVKNNDYNHIFVCTDLPLESEITNNDNVKEWVGLGNMMYLGKGFSNIRITKNDYAYSTNNTFPEEVFLHEFLHTLERNAKAYGYTIPALHDYEKYGYKEDKKDGLRKWYYDYMNENIINNGKYIGLPSEVYSLRPAQNSDFEYAYKLDKLDEPKSISKKIESIIYKIKEVFKAQEIQKTQQNLNVEA